MQETGEGAGGYAKEMSEDFLRQQRAMGGARAWTAVPSQVGRFVSPMP